MRRTLTVGCAIICVATAYLWYRSYIVSDYIGWNDADYGKPFTFTVQTDEGLIAIWWGNVWVRRTPFGGPPAYRPWADHVMLLPQNVDLSPRTTFGFGSYALQDGIRDTRNATLPYWSVVLPAAVLPALAIRRWWRRRRYDQGMCRSCGYDLRASLEQCPECGEETKPPTRTEGAVSSA